MLTVTEVEYRLSHGGQGGRPDTVYRPTYVVEVEGHDRIEFTPANYTSRIVARGDVVEGRVDWANQRLRTSASIEFGIGVAGGAILISVCVLIYNVREIGNRRRRGRKSHLYRYPNVPM